jgi:erythromycin esterase-like protein
VALAGCAGARADAALVEEVRGAARALPEEPATDDALVALLASAEVVLIGEETHGTEEFYRTREALTRRLIEEHGFRGVLVEGSWPFAARVDRMARGGAADPDPLGDFTDFPRWMWRNTVVQDFVTWLAARNAAQPEAGRRAGFFGLDLYSLAASLEQVTAYLARVDPPAAERARQARACFQGEETDPTLYGLRVSRAPRDSCQEEVGAVLAELEASRARYVGGGGGGGGGGEAAEDAYFDARQNARVVVSAEAFYRQQQSAFTSTWNLRDRHFAATLEAVREHLGRGGAGPVKLVVWAHNSHVWDERASAFGPQGQVNLGQLARERYGERAFLLGQTTHEGSVVAAAGWGGPGRTVDVRAPDPDTLEAAFHDVSSEGGPARFLLVLRGQEAALPLLQQPRLSRAIGVVYLPLTERQSHYIEGRLGAQFDAVLHHDRTRALTPLDPR